MESSSNPKFTMNFSATHLKPPALSILLHEFWLSGDHPVKMSSEDLFYRVFWSAFNDVWVGCGMEVKPGMRNPSRKKPLMNASFTEMETCSLASPILSNAFTHASVLTGRPITNDNFHFQIISYYLCSATVSKFNLFLTIQTVYSNYWITFPISHIQGEVDSFKEFCLTYLKLTVCTCGIQTLETW